MKEKIVNLIADHVEGMTAEEIATFIEIPPKQELGDYAFPCFRLAKTMHKAPNLIAADIKEAIGDVDFLDKIDVQGAYLNFLRKERYLCPDYDRSCIKGQLWWFRRRCRQGYLYRLLLAKRSKELPRWTPQNYYHR